MNNLHNSKYVFDLQESLTVKSIFFTYTPSIYNIIFPNGGVYYQAPNQRYFSQYSRIIYNLNKPSVSDDKSIEETNKKSDSFLYYPFKYGSFLLI
jgi:hypothetical protein